MMLVMMRAAATTTTRPPYLLFVVEKEENEDKPTKKKKKGDDRERNGQHLLVIPRHRRAPVRAHPPGPDLYFGINQHVERLRRRRRRIECKIYLKCPCMFRKIVGRRI
jgi:hypothetical protein